jgi:hypothetical protein
VRGRGRLRGAFDPDILHHYQEDIRERRSRKDLYESLLFQSLVPAFDDIPMRRVFPVCLYTPDESSAIHTQLAIALHAIIATSGCDTVQTYRVLNGSKTYRGLLQTPNRQTHDQFQDSSGQLTSAVIKALQEAGGSVTIRFGPEVKGRTPEDKPQRREGKAERHWTENFEAFTSSIRNLFLIGVGATLLFDGIHATTQSRESSKRPEVSIMQLDRGTQIKILPDILDAEKPEDFRKIMEGLEGSAIPPKATPQPSKPRSR